MNNQRSSSEVKETTNTSAINKEYSRKIILYEQSKTIFIVSCYDYVEFYESILNHIQCSLISPDNRGTLEYKFQNKNHFLMLCGFFFLF